MSPWARQALVIPGELVGIQGIWVDSGGLRRVTMQFTICLMGPLCLFFRDGGYLCLGLE